MMRATQWMAMAMAVGAWLAVSGGATAGVQSLGGSLPNPAAGSYTTLLAADLLGGIYACDGDWLYKYSGSAFTPLYTGIVAAGGVAFDPSALAVSADGSAAYVASGNTGKVVRIDLAGATPTAVGLANAGLTSGSNYGLAVDPIYGQLFITDSWTQALYVLDPAGTGPVTLLDDFGGTGVLGSGIGFSPDGRLVVPVGKEYATKDDDTFPVDLYRFSRAWLDDLSAGVVTTDAGDLYASDLLVSGSGTVGVDSTGNAYLAASDAIYWVSANGSLGVLVGDTTPHVWWMFDYGFMGLAYDAKEDRLVTGYAASFGDAFGLTAVDPVPEPATLGLVVVGLAGLLARRRTR